jgi:hypothetical protein
MNAEPDPGAEDRKGCSGHIGKMIFSAGVEQLAIVAYVPAAEHNKARDRRSNSGRSHRTRDSAAMREPRFEQSADKVDAEAWLADVCTKVGAEVSKAVFDTVSLIPNNKSGDLLTGEKGKITGKVACAIAKSNPEAGKFALKDKDAAMAAAFAFLRSKGAFVPTSRLQPGTSLSSSHLLVFAPRCGQPEDNDDDSDEMIFGDDDNLDDY